MRAKNETGVVIERGLRDWQILQQDEAGAATIRLAGRWLTDSSFKRGGVYVRVVWENSYEVVTKDLDWQRARTCKDGTWSIKLSLPTGGLYRVETTLWLDGPAIEWGQRGDVIHHVGVGDIWLIAGQSNATGYGKMPVDDGPELGIHMFHADGRWKLASHPLADSTNTQYPPNRDGANPTHSPWLAFARKLKQRQGYPIGLIPASLGGSPMAKWNPEADGVLLANALRYVRDAGGVVRGMIWYQGESDVERPARNAYADGFRAMVKELRKSVKSPKLPVLTVQLNRCVGHPEESDRDQEWPEMRQLQRQLATEIDGVEIVSIFDVLLSDGIHNVSNGNLLIGQRLAHTALGAVYGKSIAWRHPDCCEARLVDAKTIELSFVNLGERLNFPCALKQQFPFAVEDGQGALPVDSWELPAADRFRLHLGREPVGPARVIGVPGANPSVSVPIDISGYRPILGFIEPVQTD